MKSASGEQAASRTTTISLRTFPIHILREAKHCASFPLFRVTNCQRYDATVTICEITLCAGEYMNDMVGNAGVCGSAGLWDTGAGFAGPRIMEIPALVSLSIHCLLHSSGYKV